MSEVGSLQEALKALDEMFGTGEDNGLIGEKIRTTIGAERPNDRYVYFSEGTLESSFMRMQGRCMG